MRHISKGKEPAQLAELKRGDPDWVASWEALDGTAVKRAIKAALLQEQGYVCCYCERRVAQDSSHIEHVAPRSKAASLDLAWSNLLASCNSEAKAHCGAAKGNWYLPEQFVSPLHADCEGRFSFHLDGSVTPARNEDDAARVTIARLRLDIKTLRAMRRAVILAALPDTDEEPLDDERAVRRRYLSRDASLQFQPFAIAIVAALREFQRK